MPSFTEQINIFLLLLGLAQWTLLFLFLLRKKRGLADIYFMLMLIVVGLQMIFKVAAKIWLMENLRLPYVLSYELPFLIGPLLYLMVKARVSTEFDKKDIIHLFPFLIFCAIASLYKTTLIARLGLTAYGHGFLQLLSLGIYSLYAWRLAKKENKTKNIRPFIVSMAIAETLIIVALAVMYVYYRRFPDVRMLFAGLTFLIYWISYRQMMEPHMFLAVEGHVLTPLAPRNQSKYTHSGLKAEEADRIFQSVQKVMTDQKLFLDPSLTIDTLAAELGISRHHLSQVINAQFQKPYFDLVNDYRLNEVKSRLLENRYRHYTIAAIALDSGFNSVSSFNELFKKRFGVPPSRFRELNLRKMTA